MQIDHAPEDHVWRLQVKWYSYFRPRRGATDGPETSIEHMFLFNDFAHHYTAISFASDSNVKNDDGGRLNQEEIKRLLDDAPFKVFNEPHGWYSTTTKGSLTVHFTNHMKPSKQQCR